MAQVTEYPPMIIPKAVALEEAYQQQIIDEFVRKYHHLINLRYVEWLYSRGKNELC